MLTRTIVGIGGLYLARGPETEEPAGLAAAIPIGAVRLGQGGVAVTRIGQDRDGDGVIERLRADGVDTSHVQRDPDLPTPRVEIRGVDDLWTPVLPDRTAFDNLQWDFDLEDSARAADIVIYGAMAYRDAQAGSVIDRFLSETSGAVALADLTSRPRVGVDRQTLRAALDNATAAIVDATALGAVTTASDPSDAADRLVRSAELGFVLRVESSGPDDRLAAVVHGEEGPLAPITGLRRRDLPSVIAALTCGARAQWPLERCVEAARRVAAFVAEHPDDTVPADVLAGE
ncbi:MAG: PfkB family carbohydrate kinase [Planctomycetota bacterium]|jgi:sugar/nucleoside kinase (ribokinase family)